MPPQLWKSKETLPFFADFFELLKVAAMADGH
jgi:hypothetical protein